MEKKKIENKSEKTVLHNKVEKVEEKGYVWKGKTYKNLADTPLSLSQAILYLSQGKITRV